MVDQVKGEESGAIGIVEEGSSNQFLIVSNIIGDFKSGEEVQQGDKVSRIIEPAEVTDFHFVDTTQDITSLSSFYVKCIGSSIEMIQAVDYIT